MKVISGQKDGPEEDVDEKGARLRNGSKLTGQARDM